MAPLAFGKSVFTKAAAGAAAGGAEFGFVTGQHGDPNTSGHARMTVRPNAGATKFADSSNFAFSLWFRALLGDFSSGQEFGVLIGMTADANISREVEIYINAQRDGVDRIQNHSIVFFCKYSGGTRSISSWATGADYFTSNADFDSKVLDGNWHNLSGTFSGTNTERQLLLDGVDINVSRTDGPGDSVTGSINLDTDSYAASPPLNTGTDNGLSLNLGINQGIPPGFGACFDIGPIWIYDSQIDFETSSVMEQYYNSSNTDGYVTAGSDGESGGAAEPELFINTDGTSMSNGGRLGTVTFHEVEDTGGSVTQTSSSTGPGSGDTRTSANT
jgi:hypothetical protein